jgi:hypothetical protein
LLPVGMRVPRRTLNAPFTAEFFGALVSIHRSSRQVSKLWCRLSIVPTVTLTLASLLVITHRRPLERAM